MDIDEDKESDGDQNQDTETGDNDKANEEGDDDAMDTNEDGQTNDQLGVTPEVRFTFSLVRNIFNKLF